MLFNNAAVFEMAPVLEAYEDSYARVKDRLERKLQVMVCAGRLTLAEARMAIAKNWQVAYRKYVAPNPINELETQSEEAAAD